MESNYWNSSWLAIQRLAIRSPTTSLHCVKIRNKSCLRGNDYQLSYNASSISQYFLVSQVFNDIGVETFPGSGTRPETLAVTLGLDERVDQWSERGIGDPLMCLISDHNGTNYRHTTLQAFIH